MSERIRIRLKGYDSKVLDQAVHSIIETLIRAHATVHGPIPLPTERNLTTVLRSPHIYKDAREQFEMRTHKRLIDVVEHDRSAIDALMNIQMPTGVDITIKM